MKIRMTRHKSAKKPLAAVEAPLLPEGGA